MESDEMSNDSKNTTQNENSSLTNEDNIRETENDCSLTEKRDEQSEMAMEVEEIEDMKSEGANNFHDKTEDVITPNIPLSEGRLSRVQMNENDELSMEIGDVDIANTDGKVTNNVNPDILGKKEQTNAEIFECKDSIEVNLDSDTGNKLCSSDSKTFSEVSNVKARNSLLSVLNETEIKKLSTCKNNEVINVNLAKCINKSEEKNLLKECKELPSHCISKNNRKSELHSKEKEREIAGVGCAEEHDERHPSEGINHKTFKNGQDNIVGENVNIKEDSSCMENVKNVGTKEGTGLSKEGKRESIVVSDDEICVLSEGSEKTKRFVKGRNTGRNLILNRPGVKKMKDGVSSPEKEVKDVIYLDSKNDGVLVCDADKKTRKQCCNLECESRETLLNAPVAVLTYYGLNYVKGKSQKVCKICFETAVSHNEHLAYALMEHKPLLKENFPIRKDIALIDDSDEEGSDDELPLGESILLDVDDKLMEVIDSSLENYDLDFQIKESDAILQETYNNLNDEFSKTDLAFNELQAEIDELRSQLYRGFIPKIKELPSIDNVDSPEYMYSPDKKFRMQSLTNIHMSPSKRLQPFTSGPDSPKRSPLVGVATKKVTQVQRNTYAGVPQIDTQSQDESMNLQGQQEVVALEQVQRVQPVLPRVGPLCRPRPNVHDVLYVMKNGYYGMWARAKVLEVLTRLDPPNKVENQYKIKFESRKSSMVKNVNGKQIAYSQPSPVRLPVGTRVIALFRDEWAKECYYAGIIAEPPKSMNKYRYLVFFDDGYAQYVCHEKILLVCESSRNVWEDIHPDSRDFVRNYLEQFPERPMLKLQRGQIVKTEWNGKWWIARVLEVDGSLVKMHFDADGRTELIYRGSTRLGPLYSELANAAARKNLGSFSRHRTMGISSLKRRNMPYVEYTRSDVDENKLEDSGEINRSLEKAMPSRAVAKKSTSKRTDSAREQLEALILSSDQDIQSGHVESIYINPSYKPQMFVPHQCGHRCIEGIPYDATQIKHYNPLVLPLLHGWQRHITRCKGKKIVIYRSPCGRRLRNMEELHRYLRVTKSNLPVDLFDYDPWVHCFSEFVMRSGFINIKDLSYGHENVPVPCVNNVDHSKPEYVKYSTVRLPMEGVNVNTDPEFLVCCDCTDDCQNKEKCQCWQLTIQGTAYASGGKVDTSVGYWYKRLREPVTTGIYECNSRCKCASTCLNRVAQHPLQLRLQVFKTENRGWGIRCLNDVPHGAFICIYAGRLLTEQGANEGGKNYGDEYLAELDYIEVVERLKEGYESDVVDDEEAPFSSTKEEKAKKAALSEEDEEEEGENSHDAHDSDFELDAKHHNISVVPLEESTIRTRLRNRKARNSSIDSEGKDGGRDGEGSSSEKVIKKIEAERKGSILSSDDASSLITLSDDEDDEQREREPSRFAAMSGPKKETEKKVSYKSVREFFGDDEFCYIMDAKNDGNIGRYLNHSCSPNVFVQNVFVDTHDLRFPWVAFFALTYISAGTELTWDYNYDVGSVPGKVLHCYCGSNECRGRLL